MTDTIHLGFEVGSGKPVAIPLKHMAVTGQTQESGKTTTLEALVSRLEPGTAALTFITKRGESAFQGGDALGVRQSVRPYFRDRADWQFVDSLLAAQLQEKNKFLRPWIMKVCRTTTTLAQVHAKVKEALKTAKGMNEGVYTQLDAYLDLIVPEIHRATLAGSLNIRPGLNVMDVSAFTTPMQMLFVQSALDVVNAQCAGTIVVVPEAWEFIPEGKGSPVKSSAVNLVRKGAGLGNYIWVDSQDMAGVDKVILRGCTVWLIGVQREANEIKRNLSNIPHGTAKPMAAQVALLERGQFYACWRQHCVKTYVQPAWMATMEAQSIACGSKLIPTRPVMPPPPKKGMTTDYEEARWRVAPTHLEQTLDELVDEKFPNPKEDQVNEKEARELREENARLRREVNDLRSELQSALDMLDRFKDRPTPEKEVPLKPGEMLVPTDRGPVFDRMVEQLFLEASALIEKLLRNHPKLAVKAGRPELEVAVEREVIQVSGSSLRGRVARLIAGGFYDKGQTAAGTYKELTRQGYHADPANTNRELRALAEMGFLTIEDGKDDRGRPRSEYLVVGEMKVNVIEGR